MVGLERATHVIREDKRDNALKAIHWLLVTARCRAQSGDNEACADIVDHCERLPLFFLPGADRTDDLRNVLRLTAEHYDDCGWALTLFDGDEGA